LVPKEKTRARKALEKLIGRLAPQERIRPDFEEILAVRNPRSKEMITDQDWPSIWPVAASFRSSVVPLPVRMGYRRKPEKRIPFKTIPNFLHLTPAAIERHCKAIKKFCTQWPQEMSSSLVDEYLPLIISYSDFIHQGNSIRDNRCRIITVMFKLNKLITNERAREKFIRLIGNRYDGQTDSITIVTDRCFTRKQNRSYAEYLITALFHESLKVEPWEKLADRKDAIEVKFEGSAAEKHVIEIIHQITSKSKETEDSVREYGQEMRNLLGIPFLNHPGN
uniref:MRP-S28 domain-containing protein n=1 Tax=Dracunculus medinensis TaxID=318479 RepID=A0A0N4UGQ1_DRAME